MSGLARRLPVDARPGFRQPISASSAEPNVVLLAAVAYAIADDKLANEVNEVAV